MARERDDDYDGSGEGSGPPPSGALGPLDNTFRNTNIVVLVLFGICCGLIAFILSLVCYLTAKDPKAKSNALLVMIVGAALTVISIVLQFTGALAGLNR
jgi:hypothetical protein